MFTTHPLSPLTFVLAGKPGEGGGGDAHHPRIGLRTEERKKAHQRTISEPPKKVGPIFLVGDLLLLPKLPLGNIILLGKCGGFISSNGHSLKNVW